MELQKKSRLLPTAQLKGGMIGLGATLAAGLPKTLPPYEL